jgi:hypothetical protein
VENDPIEATFTISPNIQDLNYIHYQDVASDKWTITHNLGKFPSVTIVSSAGEQVIADVNYKSANVVEVSFMGAFAGIAYLN